MLEAQLRESPLLEVVAPSVQPRVQLELNDESWFVTDEVHGTGTDGPILFALRSHELLHARSVLEHYYQYSRPLRIAERAMDLIGSLELSALDCPGLVTAEVAQRAHLPEAARKGPGIYTLRVGATVCFRVRNRSNHRLRVTLANCEPSGRVQLLGDSIVAPAGFCVFWANDSLGSPFQMELPLGSTWSIDRLIAIGRTDLGHDLHYLRVDRMFTDVVWSRMGKDMIIGGTVDPSRAPLDHWTATQVIIETQTDGPASPGRSPGLSARR